VDSLKSFFLTACILAAPLILAAMGGLLSERSGVMNIALEGKMLSAACAGFIVSSTTGNPFFGVLAGIAAAVLLSLLHAVLTQTYKIDHIVSGMGINAIAFGGTRFFREKFGGDQAAAASFSVWLYAGLGLVAALFLAWYVRSWRGGVRLMAVGEDPEKSRQNGLDPVLVRFRALIGTGILCGLAGCLIVTNAGSFSDGMTAGKGYIALAALILGGWRPLPTLFACIAFGFIDGVQILFQGSKGLALPSEAYTALPYLATLLALSLWKQQSPAPDGLGKP